MRLDLAVIESRWWTTGNHSVRGLFELLATIHKDNPHAYHYEMFNNSASLEEIIRRVSAKSDIHNLYIATHGNRRSIFGAEGRNRIPREELGTMLGNVRRRQIDGLYLSTCLTANASTVEALLRQDRVRWVAGYSEEADWLKSASLDLYFWDCHYETYRVDDVVGRIERIARMLKGEMQPLCNSLGFNIFVPDNDGNIRKLL